MPKQEELGKRPSGSSIGSGNAFQTNTTVAAAGGSIMAGTINATALTSAPTSPAMLSTSSSSSSSRSTNPSTSIHIPAASTVSDPERTYVFPAGGAPSRTSFGGSASAPKSRVSEIMAARGHSRSVSHGGGSLALGGAGSSTTSGVGGAPGSGKVILRSAMKGHQRAFSQGQISVKEPLASAISSGTGKKSGHNRVGSKTDFILPPGHKETIIPRGELVSSASSSGTRSGHSRQASRSESIYTLRRAEMPPWWKRLLYCCPGKSSFAEDRHRIVVPNHTVPPKTPKREHPNGRRVGNKIRTTKYTLLSFVPNNLLEQFHRLANLYFIFILLLNWYVGAFGKEIAMIPVCFVLGVTAIKDLFEDRRRRASDKRINNSTCRVYNSELERYQKIAWQEVRVGDLVHLSNNETVPADILLLRSSNAHGVCYIDTCDLDGESNLKSREVVRGFADIQHSFVANKFTSRVEVDPPSTKIYRFHGAIIHDSGKRVPISSESLLLRESRLKNTDFVEGLVVYAGHETKAMLNNSGPRYKRSQLEQQMNVDIIWCVIILIILCVIGAIGCKMWLTMFEGKNVYFLPFVIDAHAEALSTFLTNIIIMQIMIPMSLYVTMELCKILQVYHIHNNSDLFDMLTNKRTECRAMNITEELGQVQHIFSDKTGTLTENKMLFRRCTVNGVDYNHPPSELEEMYSTTNAPAPPVEVNSRFLADLSATDGNQRYTASSQRIQEFFLVLTICNTVVVSASPHRDLMNASGTIESPSTIGQQSSESTNTMSTTTRNSATSDRYARLAESRSQTPSPPLLSLGTSIVSTMPSIDSGSTTMTLPPSSHKPSQHIPSLSPICSSSESTPNTNSPQVKHRSLTRTLSSMSPTAKARTIISSKISTLTSILANKAHNKRVSTKIKQSTPRKDLSSLGPHTTHDYRPIFEAESPDELALVNAAYSYDCCLVNRGPQHLVVSAFNRGVFEYEILKVLPFDSSRKCMSVVVRKAGSHEISLYTKGADSAIMAALVPSAPHSESRALCERTQEQLDMYAKQGLRVLVMAKKMLDIQEYMEWLRQHQEIEMSVDNREKRIRESYAMLEQNLVLLGATGIEDRLQEGVPETIEALRAAGIAIWVLTGDKPETAINVAYSAKVFQDKMELLRLTARSRNAAEASIMFYLDELEKDLVSQPNKQRALVVDGKTLTFILDLRSNLTKPFLKLTKYCACVLCCRSTPLQKAYLVKIVKEELHLSTLAIGDGANDVSMIQMADVGVGISGQEGMQAVMASDFTLSRFKYLEKLLLTHGFWSYDRLARMILYFFYKNATFVFLIFWFQLYCGFSGAVMIDQIYLMLYNLFFTSLPPLVIGVYDKMVAEDLLMNRPYLYRYGRLGFAYKPHSFWIVMLDSLYQSLVIFFVAEGAYWDSSVDIWEFGTTITTSCLIANLIHGAIEFRSWTILHVLSIICSLGAYYLFALLYNAVCINCLGQPSQYWVIYMCLQSPVHWLIVVITGIVCVLPRLTIRVLESTIWPDEATRAVLEQRRADRRGEDLLVAWSRSTSASSIYRASDSRIKNQTVASIG